MWGEPAMDAYPEPPTERPSPYGQGRPEPGAAGDPYAQWRSQPATGPATRSVSLLVPELECEPAGEAGRHPAPEAAPRGRRTVGIVCGLAAMAAVFGIVGALLPDPDPGAGDATLADLATSANSSASPSAQGPGPAPSAVAGPSSGRVAATAAAAPAPAGIGARVRDGDLEFAVSGTRTTKSIGNEYVSTKARGQFLLVSLATRNTGDEDQLFTAAAQKLYDSRGHVYAVDCVSAAYLGDDGTNYIAQLDPGASVTVSLVFDVPPGTVPDRVELHDSLAADGVTVRLSR